MIGEKFLRRQFYKTLDGVLGRVDNTLSWILKITEDSREAIEKRNETRRKRENLQKNFINEDNQENLDQIEKAKQTSMLHSQGKVDHSGSSYHGPGKPLNGKVNSNMAQRNFDNHQGN